MNIAVLGAGPMGLAVAYQLVLDGFKPVIFEADDRIGGMTASFDFDGLDIERYYHFHCTSDDAFLATLEELGINDKMRWTKTKMGFWYDNKLQPWGNPIALLNFKGLSIFSKIRYGLHAFFSTKRNNWKSLDTVEASTWIKSWVGNEAWDVLWRSLFEYKFYNYADKLSAAWIWSRIRRIGKSRYSIFNEKLGYLEGGSTVLLDSLKNTIELKGGKILLKSPVQKVIIENGSVQGVLINKKFEPFDKVISTIPIPLIPNLIPDLPTHILEKLSSIKNIAVVCVIAKLRKPVSENFWVNINDPTMIIPGFVEYSNLRPLNNHVVYVPFYMPAELPLFSKGNEHFIEMVKSFLKKINPHLVKDDFIDIRVSRYRYAQPICEPNFFSKIPSLDLPVKGLWFADTSYYYPEDRGISESINFGRKLAKRAIKSTLNNV